MRVLDKKPVHRTDERAGEWFIKGLRKHEWPPKKRMIPVFLHVFAPYFTRQNEK
jgi:hypothetical protein